MRRRTSWGLVSLLVLSYAYAAGAAESTQGGRHTIGLALEGGAAHGLAHIGVLEWFDAHHIPVDYIAGTSMEPGERGRRRPPKMVLQVGQSVLGLEP